MGNNTLKIVDMGLKVILSLILLSSLLGAVGVFPAPTPEMYNNIEAYEFIKMLMSNGYIVPIQTLVFMAAFYCMWTKRMALAMLLILPIVVNIVAFHAFLDGGLLTGGAVMGNIFAAINIYFIWKERASYMSLLRKSN